MLHIIKPIDNRHFTYFMQNQFCKATRFHYRPAPIFQFLSRHGGPILYSVHCTVHILYYMSPVEFCGTAMRTEGLNPDTRASNPSPPPNVLYTIAKTTVGVCGGVCGCVGVWVCVCVCVCVCF